ncbi:thiamine-monophosphate kinase [Siccirubricoccus deserti]|uniref:Thiamine-monophosphate kinase n=1 Tax=Siccirubricoccus deserti TaxID=2013562 RepID=A0A9X0R0I3_9PROT|nr:thiamine-phosphate kinase [Siccirubricoccus deserti]MBC4017270.1 thiamine-phosphate kinase [Siccirubricoccus deserti]GGC57744.1 thiamine-monophosphate kinase [Siccirubricoccus deserti]
MGLPGEFALIARHFRRLAGPAALDLKDDAAVLDPPPGRQLVLAADAMVAGVHFLAEDPPETIGRKLLRVNLSDLAAMGATPLGYLMTTALPPGTSDAWLGRFVDGLAADQAAFGLSVLGGDTVSIPGPMTLSLTILGSVAPGAALRRQGARPGDALWVSGTLGDGALGLRVLQGKLPGDAAGHLARRYRLPEPRLALGSALAGVARATMDVSDGLVQDLGHLCRAGGCGAVLKADSVPLSPAARALVEADPALLPLLLTGGDDYELLFAAPATAEAEILARAAAAGVAVTLIGGFVAGPPEVQVRGPDGAPMTLPAGGWSHF